LDRTAATRYHLGEETALCGHMLTMVELAQKRRRSVIDAGRIGEDICGYDYRLDSISARDAFAAFIKSPQGDAILAAKELGVPPAKEGEADDDLARGMCERKRCKPHQHWLKTFTLAIKYQIKEMVRQAAEIAEQEKVVREAALERSRRKRAESNRVEVL
jgi:COMPASS component SPP1